MKLRRIFKPWNIGSGRKRRPLVLPKGKAVIPTAVVPVKVELIEGYQVLKKFVINDMWCFIIIEDGYWGHSIRIISFDDEGAEFDVVFEEYVQKYMNGTIVNNTLEISG